MNPRLAVSSIFLAVFWEMFAIGLSGFMLWFPEKFSYIFPGWFINIAALVHSEEALLAALFIFTVHFFNNHIVPNKFPLSTAIGIFLTLLIIWAVVL